MRFLLLAAIRAYQRHVSPRKGFHCAYRVHAGGASCSAFGYRAVRRHGVFTGLGLLRERLHRCGQVHRAHHPAAAPAPRGRLAPGPHPRLHGQRGFVDGDGADCGDTEGCGSDGGCAQAANCIPDLGCPSGCVDADDGCSGCGGCDPGDGGGGGDDEDVGGTRQARSRSSGSRRGRRGERLGPEDAAAPPIDPFPRDPRLPVD